MCCTYYLYVVHCIVQSTNGYNAKMHAKTFIMINNKLKCMHISFQSSRISC